LEQALAAAGKTSETHVIEAENCSKRSTVYVPRSALAGRAAGLALRKEKAPVWTGAWLGRL